MKQTVDVFQEKLENSMVYTGSEMDAFLKRTRSPHLQAFKQVTGNLHQISVKEISNDTKIYEGIYYDEKEKIRRLFLIKHRQEFYSILKTEGEVPSYFVADSVYPLFFLKGTNSKEWMILFQSFLLEPKEKTYQKRTMYELVKKENNEYELLENRVKLDCDKLKTITSELYMELFAIHHRIMSLTQENPQKKRVKKQ